MCFGVGVPLQVVVDASGAFTLQLGVDEIVTVSTVEMHRGDDSHANDGLPIVPASTAWPRGVEAGLTGLAVDAPMVGAIVTVDQQGVWEVGDIDSTLSNPSLATGGAVCASHGTRRFRLALSIVPPARLHRLTNDVFPQHRQPHTNV